MNTPPPLFRDQRKVDQDHLNILVAFHFVVAALALFGIGFLALHYHFMSVMFEPGTWEGKHQGPLPPPQFFAMFKWFYVVMGVMMTLATLGNLLAGLFLRARKHRIFCLIIAGLNCLQFPFGTALGVFTILVLARGSVVELYELTGQG